MIAPVTIYKPLVHSDSNDVNVVAAVINTLTNFREEHPSRIQHSFNFFATLISQINLPLRGSVFAEINAFFALNGGLVMCQAAWDRRSMDVERAYYLSRLSSLLRVDLLAKVDPLQLESLESRHLYYFLKEFENIRTKGIIDPEKLHELSEFLETEHRQLQESLSLHVFLKTLQALNIFTHASLAYMALKPFNCAELFSYWFKKIPENERMPSFTDFERIIKDVGEVDFTRHLPEEKFEENRWEAFHMLNLLTEKQLLMWHENGSFLSRNYRKIQNRMRRGQERMIHVCLIDNLARIERDEKKACFFQKILLVVKRIMIWLTGYVYHHPFFLTHFPEDKCYKRCGKKDKNGIYHDPDLTAGSVRKYLPEFEINVVPWLPQDADEHQFTQIFFERLEEVIRPKNKHLKSPSYFVKLWKACIPNFQPTVPSEIHLADPKEREILCNQFVGEALVEAHVGACRKLNLPIPGDLSFYGFKKWENLGSMTPTHFAEGLIRVGVLRRCFCPLI